MVSRLPVVLTSTHENLLRRAASTRQSLPRGAEAAAPIAWLEEKAVRLLDAARELWRLHYMPGTRAHFRDRKHTWLVGAATMLARPEALRRIRLEQREPELVAFMLELLTARPGKDALHSLVVSVGRFCEARGLPLDEAGLDRLEAATRREDLTFGQRQRLALYMVPARTDRYCELVSVTTYRGPDPMRTDLEWLLRWRGSAGYEVAMRVWWQALDDTECRLLCRELASFELSEDERAALQPRVRDRARRYGPGQVELVEAMGRGELVFDAPLLAALAEHGWPDAALRAGRLLEARGPEQAEAVEEERPLSGFVDPCGWTRAQRLRLAQAREGSLPQEQRRAMLLDLERAVGDEEVANLRAGIPALQPGVPRDRNLLVRLLGKPAVRADALAVCLAGLRRGAWAPSVGERARCVKLASSVSGGKQKNRTPARQLALLGLPAGLDLWRELLPLSPETDLALAEQRDLARLPEGAEHALRTLYQRGEPPLRRRLFDALQPDWPRTLAPAWSALALSASPPTQASAAEAFGRLGWVEWEPALQDLAQRADPRVQEVALQALGVCGTRASGALLSELAGGRGAAAGAARAALAALAERLGQPERGGLALAGGEEGGLALAAGEEGGLALSGDTDANRAPGPRGAAAAGAVVPSEGLDLGPRADWFGLQAAPRRLSPFVWAGYLATGGTPWSFITWGVCALLLRGLPLGQDWETWRAWGFGVLLFGSLGTLPVWLAHPTRQLRLLRSGSPVWAELTRTQRKVRRNKGSESVTWVYHFRVEGPDGTPIRHTLRRSWQSRRMGDEKQVGDRYPREPALCWVPPGGKAQIAICDAMSAVRASGGRVRLRWWVWLMMPLGPALMWWALLGLLGLLG